MRLRELCGPSRREYLKFNCAVEQSIHKRSTANHLSEHHGFYKPQSVVSGIWRRRESFLRILIALRLGCPLPSPRR
jgi:hypothetical protein